MQLLVSSAALYSCLPPHLIQVEAIVHILRYRLQGPGKVDHVVDVTVHVHVAAASYLGGTGNLTGDVKEAILSPAVCKRAEAHDPMEDPIRFSSHPCTYKKPNPLPEVFPTAASSSRSGSFLLVSSTGMLTLRGEHQ